MTLQNNDIFYFVASSWGTHLSSFFIFSICFKCQTTTEQSTLNSLTTSRVVVRGSASMIFSIGCCQLLMVSHYTPHLQGSHLLCKASWKTILSSLHRSTPLSYKGLYISVFICFCSCVDTLLFILPLRVWFEMVMWEYPELIFSHGRTDPTATYATTSSEKKKQKQKLKLSELPLHIRQMRGNSPH